MKDVILLDKNPETNLYMNNLKALLKLPAIINTLNPYGQNSIGT